MFKHAKIMKKPCHFATTVKIKNKENQIELKIFFHIETFSNYVYKHMYGLEEIIFCLWAY